MSAQEEKAQTQVQDDSEDDLLDSAEDVARDALVAADILVCNGKIVFNEDLDTLHVIHLEDVMKVSTTDSTASFSINKVVRILYRTQKDTLVALHPAVASELVDTIDAYFRTIRNIPSV